MLRRLGARMAPISRSRVGLAALGVLVLLAAACQNPWIRVQNLGSSPATVTISYYDESGQVVAQDSRLLAPGEASNFPVGSNDQLAHGYHGSALIESDQPLLALRRTDMAGNSADMLDGEIMGAVKEGGSIYLPLVMSNAGPFQSWSTKFAVQNLSDSMTSCLTITYINATGAEIATDPPRPARGAAQPGCAKGGRPLAPRATLRRDPTTLGVPSGFAGAARIDTVQNDQGDAPGKQFISASVDTWNGPFNLLSSYSAMTRSDLSGVVLLPLVEREVGPDSSYSTNFQIMSSDPTHAILVQLHFEGVDGNGNPVSKDSTVSLTGVKLCDQTANDANNCLAPGDSLPSGFSGFARLTASASVGVVVQRGSYFGDYGSYRGVPVAAASSRVALPAVKGNSWMRILVSGGGAATVRLRYFGPQLDGGEQSSTVTINGLGTIFQQQDPAVPNDFDGAAILESDRPIVVVSWYSADFGKGDRALLYNGVEAP